MIPLLFNFANNELFEIRNFLCHKQKRDAGDYGNMGFTYLRRDMHSIPSTCSECL